ncbi:hypothetical protein D3C85_249870 [compost metagenome]
MFSQIAQPCPFQQQAPRPCWRTDSANPQGSGAGPATKPGHSPTRHCPAATIRTSTPDLNRRSNRSTREASPGRRVEQFARCRGTTSSKSSAQHLADKSAHRHARVPRPFRNRLVTRYPRRLVTWSPSGWLLSALDIVTFSARKFARTHARHPNSRAHRYAIEPSPPVCTRREEPARKATWPPGST